MPDRIVRESILTSEAVNRLSFGAEVFYRRLMSKADEYGRYHSDPQFLLDDLFPKKLRFQHIEWQHIYSYLIECVTVGLVVLYSVEEEPFLEIQNWHQPIDPTRSRYPDPPLWFTKRKESVKTEAPLLESQGWKQ